MSEPVKPRLFNNKSLVVVTKVVAIYAAFNLLTIAIKIYTERIEPSLSTEYINAIYFVGIIHLVILVTTIIMLLKKQYSWIVTGLCIVASLSTRFYFEELANWLN